MKLGLLQEHAVTTTYKHEVFKTDASLVSTIYCHESVCVNHRHSLTKCSLTNISSSSIFNNELWIAAQFLRDNEE